MALKKKKRVQKREELAITSMMDMMTIILVFLLKSYASTEVTVTHSEDMQLPTSSAAKAPELAVQLMVSKTEILVDGVPVLGLTTVQDEENPGEMLIAVPEDENKGQMITDLYDRLLDKAEQAKALGEASGSEQHAFKGRILLQCDQNLPFSVIREVMYTAGQAQFSEFKFVVYKTE